MFTKSPVTSTKSGLASLVALSSWRQLLFSKRQPRCKSDRCSILSEEIPSLDEARSPCACWSQAVCSASLFKISPPVKHRAISNATCHDHIIWRSAPTRIVENDGVNQGVKIKSRPVRVCQQSIAKGIPQQNSIVYRIGCDLHVTLQRAGRCPLSR